MPELNVLNQKIAYIKINDKDYISITDMLKSKDGRYGGTYAHKDIAFEFGMWISPKFKLLLIKEFERIKAEEQKQILNDTDIKYLNS